MDEVVIRARFRGPPESGNGGYSAGLAARELTGGAAYDGRPVTVRLSSPPPLDTPLSVARGDGEVRLEDGDTLVARATWAEEVAPPVPPVPPVSLDEAVAASARFPGHAYHPFPTCFVCGTARRDGLRILPGPVGEDRVAAAWTPSADLAASAYAVTWAALDCIGGWASDLGDRLLVLGQMSASIHALPAVGEPHVVLARPVDADERKARAACTMYDADERVVARADQVWVRVDPSTFQIARKQ